MLQVDLIAFFSLSSPTSTPNLTRHLAPKTFIPHRDLVYVVSLYLIPTYGSFFGVMWIGTLDPQPLVDLS